MATSLTTEMQALEDYDKSNEMFHDTVSAILYDNLARDRVLTGYHTQKRCNANFRKKTAFVLQKIEERFREEVQELINSHHRKTFHDTHSQILEDIEQTAHELDRDGFKRLCTRMEVEISCILSLGIPPAGEKERILGLLYASSLLRATRAKIIHGYISGDLSRS